MGMLVPLQGGHAWLDILEQYMGGKFGLLHDWRVSQATSWACLLSYRVGRFAQLKGGHYYMNTWAVILMHAFCPLHYIAYCVQVPAVSPAQAGCAHRPAEPPTQRGRSARCPRTTVYVSS